MRTLTSKQKKLLTEWCEEHPNMAGHLWFNLSQCDDFSLELLEKLEEINDTEILIWNIENFVRSYKKEALKG